MAEQIVKTLESIQQNQGQRAKAELLADTDLEMTSEIDTFEPLETINEGKLSWIYNYSLKQYSIQVTDNLFLS